MSEWLPLVMLGVGTAMLVFGGALAAMAAVAVVLIVRDYIRKNR